MTNADLSSLRARLAAERARAEESRPSRTSDGELDHAIERVAGADAAVAADRMDAASRQMSELASVVGDSWPHSDLGAEILRASHGLGRRSGRGSDPAAGADRRGGPSLDDEPAAQPWPGWIRYTLLAGLFAVVGIGLVVALYDKGFLPIAGPFVVLLLTPLLIPLRRRGLRNRARRRERKAAGQLGGR